MVRRVDADRFDRELVFRGHGAPLSADRGCVALPKMFRRASPWSMLQLAKVSKESFAEYLYGQSRRASVTCDGPGHRAHSNSPPKGVSCPPA
jgi:hypothetical protein